MAWSDVHCGEEGRNTLRGDLGDRKEQRGIGAFRTISMNSGQKILLLMTLSCGVVVAGVHWQQSNEKSVMHQGVLRDLERIRLKNVKKL